MRDLTFTDVERLEAAEIDVPFEMDEDAFRAFYDRTARSLWSYLARITSDPSAADDLLQESFYRFLRTRVNWESESHRRAYLFRIATNLVRDGQRRSRSVSSSIRNSIRRASGSGRMPISKRPRTWPTARISV